MSEMYLIAAECASDTDAAGTWLNTLRNQRNSFTVEVSSDNLEDLLALEYRKEFWGEGQMFYYLKRHVMEKIPDGTKESGTISMVPSYYVIPLPDGETSMREGLDQ